MLEEVVLFSGCHPLSMTNLDPNQGNLSTFRSDGMKRFQFDPETEEQSQRMKNKFVKPKQPEGNIPFYAQLPAF